MITRVRMDPTADLSRVKDFINSAYFQVCVEAEANVPAPTTINMVNGTSRYTLAATIARIKEIYVTPVGQSQPQDPLSYTTLDDIIHRRQGTGATAQAGQWPTHYTLLGINDLEVWPTPAGVDVLSVYYVAYPTALSANGDLPIIEEPYATNLLQYGALSQAGDWKGDPATDRWKNLFEEWMGRYLNHLKEKKGGIPGYGHTWGRAYRA